MEEGGPLVFLVAFLFCKELAERHSGRSRTLVSSGDKYWLLRFLARVFCHPVAQWWCICIFIYLYWAHKGHPSWPFKPAAGDVAPQNYRVFLKIFAVLSLPPPAGIRADKSLNKVEAEPTKRCLCRNTESGESRCSCREPVTERRRAPSQRQSWRRRSDGICATAACVRFLQLLSAVLPTSGHLWHWQLILFKVTKFPSPWFCNNNCLSVNSWEIGKVQP